jgi:tRNA-2-methylthio-N6-dimethylallyladenosine synthase
MLRYENICRHIHLPAQSGSTEVLKRMNRTYSRDWYIDKINGIRDIIPGCSISTDIITGFCGEGEDDHQQTLSLMDYVRFDLAYMFAYSERPGTPAEKKLIDDVPEQVKSRRLAEIVELQHQHQLENNIKEQGKQYEVLVEGYSKRSKDDLVGRTSRNKVIIFPAKNFKKGQYVNVVVQNYTSATLRGEAL